MTDRRSQAQGKLEVLTELLLLKGTWESRIIALQDKYRQEAKRRCETCGFVEQDTFSAGGCECERTKCGAPLVCQEPPGHDQGLHEAYARKNS